MKSLVKCPLCGGEASSLSAVGAVKIYQCDRCRHEFPVRVHFIDNPIPLETKVFAAIVPANNPADVRKTQMKVKRVFEGMNNFYADDLVRQISRGDRAWKLGFYSEDEVLKLRRRAVEIGLSVEFIPS